MAGRAVALAKVGAGEENRTLVIITNVDLGENAMIQRRKRDETPPFQATGWTLGELIPSGYHSRPHLAALAGER